MHGPFFGHDFICVNLVENSDCETVWSGSVAQHTARVLLAASKSFLFHVSPHIQGNVSKWQTHAWRLAFLPGLFLSKLSPNSICLKGQKMKAQAVGVNCWYFGNTRTIRLSKVWRRTLTAPPGSRSITSVLLDALAVMFEVHIPLAASFAQPGDCRHNNILSWLFETGQTGSKHQLDILTSKALWNCSSNVSSKAH